MSNYATLKSAIQQVIKTNGNNEITGAILQQTLLSIITSLGAQFQFAGVATPTTNPGTPDQNVAYIAGPGTYPNFNGLVVSDGEVAILKYNGTWTKDATGAATAKDVSKLNGVISQLRTEVNHIADFKIVNQNNSNLPNFDESSQTLDFGEDPVFCCRGKRYTPAQIWASDKSKYRAIHWPSPNDDGVGSALILVFNTDDCTFAFKRYSVALAPAECIVGGLRTSWASKHVIAHMPFQFTINSFQGYQFAGIATPTTNPGTPNQKVFYIASESGTYPNFGGLTVSDGEVAILKYNGTWTKDVTGATAKEASRLGREVSELNGAVYGQKKAETILPTRNGSKGNPGNDNAVVWLNIPCDGYEAIHFRINKPFAAAGNIYVFGYTLPNGSYHDNGAVDIANGFYQDDINKELTLSVKGLNFFTIQCYETSLPFSYPSSCTPVRVASFANGEGLEYYLTKDNEISKLRTEVGQEVSQLGLKVVDAPGTTVKNLNYKPLQQGSLTWTGDETASDTIIRTDFIDVEPGKTYVVYSNHGLIDETQYLFEYTAEGVYIKNTDYYQTTYLKNGTGFTVGDSTYKIRIRSNAGFSPDTSEIIVEEGTSVHMLYGVHAAMPYLITKNDKKAQDLVDIFNDFSIKYPGVLFSPTGTVTSIDSASMTAVYDVLPGDKLYYGNSGGINNGYVLYAFLNDYLPSPQSVMSGYAGISKNTSNNYVELEVPEGAKAIVICYRTDRKFSSFLYRYTPISAKQIEPNVDITNDYINEWRDAYLDSSYNKAGYAGIKCRFYAVTPGETLYIERKGTNGQPFFAFMNTFDLGTDGANKVVKSTQDIGNHSWAKAAYKTFVTVPDNAKVLAINFATGYEPIVRSDSPTRKNGNTIFNFNPGNSVWPKLAHCKFRSRNNYNNLALIHFSDIHRDSENLSRIAKFFDYYKTFYKEGHYTITYIDDVLATGDQVGSGNGEDFDWWAANGGSPMLQAIGNHDAWVWDNNTPTTTTEQQCYEKFIAPYVANWGVTQPSGAGENGYYPCYYYKDYMAAGIRMIVLDCMHYTTDGTSTVTESTPGTQDAWFKATMADAKANNLAILVVSHYMPFSLTLDNDVNFCEMQATLSSDMINSLAPDAVKSFIEEGGEFIMWIGGHQHRDFWGSNANYPGQICYLIETANCDYWNEGTIEHLEFTKTQDCFNIISFDTVNKVVKLVRIGNDRDAMLKHKGTLVYNYSTHQIVHQD